LVIVAIEFDKTQSVERFESGNLVLSAVKGAQLYHVFQSIEAGELISATVQAPQRSDRVEWIETGDLQ